jgi:hypothetical protein
VNGERRDGGLSRAITTTPYRRRNQVARAVREADRLNMKLLVFARCALQQMVKRSSRPNSSCTDRYIVQAGHGQDLDGPVLEAMDTRDEKELDTVLLKAMADLDPDERAVLIRKTAGFSGDEIAVAMDARSDVRLLFNQKGELLHPKDWPDETANSVESVDFYDTSRVKRVRLGSKTMARRTILEQTGKLKGSTGTGLDALAEAMREVSWVQRPNAVWPSFNGLTCTITECHHGAASKCSRALRRSAPDMCYSAHSRMRTFRLRGCFVTLVACM